MKLLYKNIILIFITILVTEKALQKNSKGTFRLFEYNFQAQIFDNRSSTKITDCSMRNEVDIHLIKNKINIQFNLLSDKDSISEIKTGKFEEGSEINLFFDAELSENTKCQVFVTKEKEVYNVTIQIENDNIMKTYPHFIYDYEKVYLAFINENREVKHVECIFNEHGNQKHIKKDEKFYNNIKIKNGNLKTRYAGFWLLSKKQHLLYSPLTNYHKEFLELQKLQFGVDLGCYITVTTLNNQLYLDTNIYSIDSKKIIYEIEQEKHKMSLKVYSISEQDSIKLYCEDTTLENLEKDITIDFSLFENEAPTNFNLIMIKKIGKREFFIGEKDILIDGPEENQTDSDLDNMNQYMCCLKIDNDGQKIKISMIRKKSNYQQVYLIQFFPHWTFSDLYVTNFLPKWNQQSKKMSVTNLTMQKENFFRDNYDALLGNNMEIFYYNKDIKEQIFASYTKFNLIISQEEPHIGLDYEIVNDKLQFRIFLFNPQKRLYFICFGIDNQYTMTFNLRDMYNPEYNLDKIYEHWEYKFPSWQYKNLDQESQLKYTFIVDDEDWEYSTYELDFTKDKKKLCNYLTIDTLQPYEFLYSDNDLLNVDMGTFTVKTSLIKGSTLEEVEERRLIVV